MKDIPNSPLLLLRPNRIGFRVPSILAFFAEMGWMPRFHFLRPDQQFSNAEPRVKRKKRFRECDRMFERKGAIGLLMLA
jgi:hypothetical protein